MLAFAHLALSLISLASVHPALDPSHADLERVWQNAYERAAKDRDLGYVVKTAVKGIGSINNQTVNWLTFEHPRLTAYRDGFNARKQRWTDDEMRVSKERLARISDGKLKRMTFLATIGLHPAIRSGRIAREVNLDDLNDVRVVMQVGSQTYQALEHPGDVRAKPMEGHFKREEKVRSRRKDKDGNYRDETIETQVPYTYYEGKFSVEFDLYNADGTPRITDQDKEFTIIVILKAGDRPATFKLDEWRSAFEK
jgi:hypothetical protein